ncbi:MAG: single-stranded DNA-binding protein [Bacteroidaceae bacterium]
MSLNKVMLIGNVGKEPEVRYIDNGVAVARLSLATTDKSYKLPNGTQVPERTEWHHIIFWRGMAETVEKYVHKGDKLYVEGPIRTRTYEDKKGNAKVLVEIWAERMEMLSSVNRMQNIKKEETVTTSNTMNQDAKTEKDNLPF